ncbi:MAG TPA: glycosyltransferase [Acidimicrobiales bacterium]|jgi:glycosyltransferase involved in cell wall biosynthesis|nr:glycosyltransferase [Acidimicrobiales bacterium]
MKVCIVPPPGSWRHQGGHKTQQFQTARALSREGLSVVVADAEFAASGGFDVVHFFGDPAPLLAFGRPRGQLIVSPVHFPASVQLGPVRTSTTSLGTGVDRVRHVGRCVRHPRDRRRQWDELRRSLRAVASADKLVVNSQAEGKLLVEDLHRYVGAVSVPPIHVAYSGVEDLFFSGSSSRGRALVGDAPFVLCVARPEQRKNQVALSRAMQGVDRRLVLIGEVLPGNERFLARCREMLPSLLHLSELGPRDLADVYAAAEVHVLASHFETTGLATLEALAAGTPCVVGRGSCVAEYYGTAVRSVDPNNYRDIRRGILEALDRPTGSEAATAHRYPWTRTGQELLAAYEA